jgi:hypothetical protein
VNALAAGGPLSANGNSETVYAVTNGYGPLTLSLDPADVTGNTVLLGGAYGGLWEIDQCGQS